MKPRVLYTTADASSQSGAVQCLLATVRGIAGCGYEPLLFLHEEFRGSPLLPPAGQARTCFARLPRLRRGQSPGYYARYLCDSIGSARRLAALLRSEGVSLVHVNEVLDLYAGVAARLAGIPCVWHVRADLPEVPLLPWLLPRVVSALASAVVAVSGSVARRVYEDQGIRTGKLDIIYDPGPDPAAFHPGVDGSPLRAEFHLAPGTLLVVLVAKLVEPKGHETLIRAAPDVLAAFPSVRFLIVGGEVPGEQHHAYAAHLRELCSGLGVQQQVVFTGFRADIPQVMAAADVVVHTSTYPDPFPGTVLQGMAVGRAVVASDIGGPREQIDHGRTGLLVPPSSPGALAAAICELLADSGRRAALGEAAARAARERFSQRAYLEALTAVYRRLGCPPGSER